MRKLLYFYRTLNSFRRYAIALGFIFLFLISFLIFSNSFQNFTPTTPAPVFSCKYFFTPVVKFHGIKENDGTLDVVKEVFQNMGYRLHSEYLEWDILWSYTYPFHSLSNEISMLKPHQKINHFPGSGYITQKSNLATLNMKSIPKSFILPNDKESFREFASNNPHKLWILKNSNHRGMKLINGTNFVLDKSSFIQEFIKNPLLISRKKFDIGVYVILTSIDPLRVYIYYGDILLRFCKKDYYPLNADSADSYIVGDDYIPIWKVEDLKFYYSELNYTSKESLNAHLQSTGKSVKKMWSQIHDTIQNVYFQTEENLKRSALMLGNLRNFFELVRFDFIIDEDLNVFLLEVNMSPNLSPAHFQQNKLLYEQIIFSSLSIVGLVRKFPSSFVYRGEAEVSNKDVQVYSEQCASQTCQHCKNAKCRLCNHCMDKELLGITKTAYLEFTNRGKYRRLIPVPTYEQETKIFPLSAMNSIMDQWFKGKCLQDTAWCF